MNLVDLAVGRLARHDAKEHPDEVIAALDDRTEAGSASSKPRTRRRAVRCAVDGIVPEGRYARRQAVADPSTRSKNGDRWPFQLIRRSHISPCKGSWTLCYKELCDS